MSSLATAISFGVEIPETLLAAEMKNHPARTMKEARNLASRALAAKAVLLARAQALGAKPEPETTEDGCEETPEEALIRQVLSLEVDVESPSLDSVRNIYESQPEGFHTPPLMEASHILIAPGKHEDANAARCKAKEILTLLSSSPRKFHNLARTFSSCPSGENGGMLGQLGPGDILDSLWKPLLDLEPGECAPRPVQTEYGWHILRLDHRIEGRRLPFRHVKAHIETQLEARAWTLAAARYVDELLKKNTVDIPALGLTSQGQLVTGDSPDERVRLVLGDVFSNPKLAVQALDNATHDHMIKVAAQRGESVHNLLSGAITAFLTSAGDSDWTHIISRLRESENPVPDCLAVIVNHCLPQKKKARTLIQTLG